MRQLRQRYVLCYLSSLLDDNWSSERLGGAADSRSGCSVAAGRECLVQSGPARRCDSRAVSISPESLLCSCSLCLSIAASSNTCKRWHRRAGRRATYRSLGRPDCCKCVCYAGRVQWVTRKKYETILRNRRSAAASRRSIVELRTEVKRLKDDLKARDEQLRVAMEELTKLRAQVAPAGGAAARAPTAAPAASPSAGASERGGLERAGTLQTAAAPAGAPAAAPAGATHDPLLMPKKDAVTQEEQVPQQHAEQSTQSQELQRPPRERDGET